MTANRTRSAATAKKSGSSSDSGSRTGKKSTAKKSATKKSAAKKSTAKKSPAQKSAAKKSATKKSPASKSTAASTSEESGNRTRSARSAPKAESRQRTVGTEVAAEAARQLLQLTGKAAEGVTGLERVDHGWTVQVEVVEVRRIPDTTDVLALYEVATDEQGELQGYRRLRRYIRGTPGGDGS